MKAFHQKSFKDSRRESLLGEDSQFLLPSKLMMVPASTAATLGLFDTFSDAGLNDS